jgi:hypothetical protein
LLVVVVTNEKICGVDYKAFDIHWRPEPEIIGQDRLCEMNVMPEQPIVVRFMSEYHDMIYRALNMAAFEG